MNSRSRNISIYAGFAAMTVLTALIGIAVMESGDPNSAKSRSVIFAVVAAWSTLEAVPLAVHSIRFGADGLSITMMMARSGISIYFGMMSLSFSNLVNIPPEAFLFARLWLTISCGSAGMLLLREVWRSYEDLTAVGRAVMISLVVALFITVFSLIIFF